MESNVEISFVPARVGHARLWPKKNSFVYQVFYTKTPITKEMDYKRPLFFSLNQLNLFSLYHQDYGPRDGSVTFYSFITKELAKAGVSLVNSDSIHLISHTRVLGFAFNPISYWLVVDEKELLKAVFCEVHNTFKETHNYLLVKRNNGSITKTDIFLADKKLYVSPFNKTEGHYEFMFDYKKDYFRSQIDYFEKSGKHVLVTYVEGASQSLTSKTILTSFVQYPFMTLFVVFGIHWQAVKLFFRKVQSTLQTRPEQYVNAQTTISRNLK